jgi:membrane protein DedA with SNARE-associated domain
VIRKFHFFYNIYIVIFLGILGSVLGALLNFFLAWKFGRVMVLKFGKYVFFKEKQLEKMERFFQKHGNISTFTGRLIPGVRQYISLPAGMAKMNVYAFASFTALGAGIWAG